MFFRIFEFYSFKSQFLKFQTQKDKLKVNNLPLQVVTLFLFHFAGFLNTNINPGRKPRMANYGLMDQIAALKWIQENIQYFGGNPKSVTLFGHNRGAACIHYLMQSPVVVPGKHMYFFVILFF